MHLGALSGGLFGFAGNLLVIVLRNVVIERGLIDMLGLMSFIGFYGLISLSLFFSFVGLFSSALGDSWVTTGMMISSGVVILFCIGLFGFPSYILLVFPGSYRVWSKSRGYFTLIKRD